MEEIDHHEGNKGQEDIKEEVIELRKDVNDQTEKDEDEDEERKINSPKTNAESNNNNGSDSFKRRNWIEEEKIQNDSFSGSLYESISKDIKINKELEKSIEDDESFNISSPINNSINSNQNIIIQRDNYTEGRSKTAKGQILIKDIL